MKMSELILAVGDDNVKFQNLFESLNNASTNKKGVTKISFSTNALTTNDLMDLNRAKLVGLVLWLPRDKVEAAIAAEKEAKK
jgi:hypothetical protein